MIVLLNGHSLTAKDRFPAEKFALNLSERQSTATITVGPEAPVIGVDNWLLDEDEPGAGIVWRVKSIDTSYETDTRTLNCEHVINTLRDRILFGEHKPSNIANNPRVSSCTATQAARYILQQQGDWTLGTVGYTKSAPYNFNGETLFDALETVSSSLMDAEWTYDLTRYPFVLNIRPKATAVSCEMRMDRNIRTLRKTIDRTRMFTRFYPIGKNNKQLPEKYVSKNENLYGIVSKVETDGEKDTEAKLRDWANEKLNNHAEPLVTVTVSGMDLSAATGESLDRLTLGTICRVPLPEFNTTITERITKLSWGDKTVDTMSVSVTLANQVEDVASIVNNLIKSGGSAGRAGAKKGEEDHAWIVDTNDHVGLVAEAVAGPGADKNWSRVSEVIVDGQGIHQRVTKTEGDIVTAESKIDANEKAITLETKSRISEDENLLGRISVEANRVSMLVSKGNDNRDILYYTTRNAFPAVGDSHYRYYAINTGKFYEWSSYRYIEIGNQDKIKAGDICIAINENGESEAYILATKIYALGTFVANQITADYINGKIASLSQVTMMGANVLGAIYLRNGAGNQQNVDGAIWDLYIKTNSNGTYTLQRKRFSETDYVDVGTFNTAGAVTLNDPVWTTPASTSPGSNSNTVTVSTSGRPVQLSKSVQVTLTRSDSWSSGTRYVYINHTDSEPEHRVAKIDVTIPNPTNLSGITTYGNSPPSGAYSFGTLSKSGLTAGKYMSMTARVGGKTFTFYFQAVA